MSQAEIQEEKKATQEEPRTSYAVRPRHQQKRLISYTTRDSMFRVRNTLNIVFILLAIAGFALYMATEWHTAAYIVMLVGVVVKIAEVSIRLFHK